jgi:hypothetical protein
MRDDASRPCSFCRLEAPVMPERLNLFPEQFACIAIDRRKNRPYAYRHAGGGFTETTLNQNLPD